MNCWTSATIEVGSQHRISWFVFLPHSVDVKAYITSVGSNSVSVCTNPDDLIGCKNVGGGFSGPLQIAFDGGRAYVANVGGGGFVSICTDPAYTPMTCSRSTGPSSTGSSTFANSNGIAFTSGSAYITNGASSSNKVSICTNTVDLSNCKLSSATFYGPSSIAFYGGFAYITNTGTSTGSTLHNTVSVCTYTTTDISICNIASSGGGLFNLPNGIAFYNNQAYIVNQSTSGSNKGKVIICSTTTDLSGCTASVFTFPDSIAQIAFYNGHAYVTNYGGGGGTTVYKCTDPPTLSSCSPKSGDVSGGTFNSPNGIAFYP